MEKVSNFEDQTIKVDDMVLTIKRSQEFHEAAKALSEYIKALELPVEQNNRLVDLLCIVTRTAEDSGFSAGLDVATQIMIAEMENKEE